MELIDDEGNIFGMVNVVDALVVLLALIVVAAGAAFVLQSDSGGEPAGPTIAAMNATLDLGTQPDYLVDELAAGDTYSPSEQTELQVTDVHLTPGDDGTRVVLGVSLRAPISDGTIDYEGAPPRVGRTLDIQTDTYQTSGTLRNLGASPESTTTSVLIEDTVSTETATAIQSGDAYELGDTSVATVESAEVYGTSDPDRKRVLVGLVLETLRNNGDPQFGGTTVRQGATIPFQTTKYALTGEVRRVGTTEPRGDPTTRTMTLQLTDVPPQLADGVREGATESVRGETIARVTAVDRESATVVLTSDDGNIYEREHPANLDLTVTADLTVRQTATGLTFKGRTIQQGSTVTLDLGSTTINATVVATE